MKQFGSRVAALDIGSVRIGVALSDPSRTLVTPRGSVPFASPQEAKVSIAILCGEDWEETSEIILGLPISLSGEENQATEQIREWGKQLGEVAGKRIHFFDERFSSIEAWRKLREGGNDSRSGKGKVDGAAAAVILEGWLANCS